MLKHWHSSEGSAGAKVGQKMQKIKEQKMQKISKNKKCTNRSKEQKKDALLVCMQIARLVQI